MSDQAIEEFSTEDRTFAPAADFVAGALSRDQALYDEADADYEAFWARQARDLLDWSTDFDTVLEWELPYAKWFLGGELNITLQLPRSPCRGRPRRQGRVPLGRRARRYPNHHLRRAAGRGLRVRERVAGLWPRKGDRVAIYMPMIPELPVAMLACARIGVAHSVIFGGFSPDAIVDRCDDADAKLIITADAGYRRGDASALKVNVDAALDAGAPSVENVVVVNRCDTDVTMVEGRDHWWHELMARCVDRVPRRANGRRAAALPALHLGHHRQAQGHHAHHRWVPDPGGVHPQVRVRPQARDRRLLVRRRHRVGHRPQLHRLRPARQRLHVGHVRRHARYPAAEVRAGDRAVGPRTGSGTSSIATASPSSTPLQPPSGPS